MKYEAKQKIDYPDYFIYSDGRVFSGKTSKFLRVFPKSTGYYSVNLYNKNGAKSFFIHRLVAELFLDNPNCYPDINHIDENKSNNSVSNLEWCNKTQNENAGTKKRREMDTKTERKAVNGRHPTAQYTLDGKLVATYNSLTEASDITGVPIGNISKAASGARNHAGGFIWRKIE